MDYKTRLQRNSKLYYFIDFFAHFEFIIPIWVAFYTHFINFTELALLHSIGLALTFVLELPTGALADLIGRKKTIMIGYLLIGVGCFITAFASSFQVFLITFSIIGVGQALVSGADVALLYDTFKELRTEEHFSKFMANTGFILRMALAVGTLIGGYFYAISAGLPYILTALSALIAALLVLFLEEPKLDSEKFTLTNYLIQTKEGFKQLLKTSHTKLLSLYYMLVGGITWACLIYFNQPFAKDIGFSEQEMSWVFGLGYIVSSLILLYMSSKAHFITRSRVYIGFPLLLIVSLIPGIFATKVILFPIVMIIQLAGSARFAYLDKYTNDEFDSKYRATAISSLNMLVSLFIIILIGISGHIQDTYNTQIIMTVLGLISLCFILPLGLKLSSDVRKQDE